MPRKNEETRGSCSGFFYAIISLFAGMLKTGNEGRILNLLVLVALVAILFESCKSIPEGQDEPLATITWDTTLQVKGVILPGDSLHIYTDIGSRTPSNRLFFVNQRFPISARFDFYGPDSDWVVNFSKEIYGGLVVSDKHSFRVPSGIRPGFYKFKAWVNDFQGRSSDTSRFQFLANGVPYPVISISRPTSLDNPVLMSYDSLNQKFILPLSCVSDSNVPGNFYFQWLDSTGRLPVSDSLPLVGKAGVGSTLKCDTSLFVPSNLVKRYKVRVGFATVQRRRMEYLFEAYRK